jgi:hypothetical protein
MTRSRRRLATACLCAVVGTIFAMPAAAGNGNGNGNGNANGNANAPGQQKKDDAAATQAAPQQQSQAPAQQNAAPQQQQQTAAPQQEQTAAPQQQSAAPQSTSSGHVPPGQAKKTESSSPSSSSTSSSPSTSSSTKNGNSSSSTPGYKPSNSTTHWTHCQTGGSTGAATCAPVQGTPNPAGKSDVSKRYGNGKTAAQIAVSRGGVGVILTGPGNSQPHKTYACGHKNNPSGGVDVHAIKSYDASACTPTTPVVPTPSCSGPMGAGMSGSCTPSTPSCTGPMGAGMSGSCTPSTPATPSAPAIPVTPAVVVTPAAPSQPTQPATGGATAGTGAVAGSTPVSTPTSTPASSAAPAAGGVLAAHTTITNKPAAHHGVLGAAATVATGTLPFTGFPVWLAVVLAAGLIATGLVIRRRAGTQLS